MSEIANVTSHQNYIQEIVRLHNELRKQGWSTEEMTTNTNMALVNDKIVYTDTLKLGKTTIAEATRIDPRTPEEVKTEAVAEKVKIQTQADAIKAKYSELIVVADSKVKSDPKEVIAK